MDYAKHKTAERVPTTGIHSTPIDTEAVLRGDREAFEQLVRQESPRLFRVIVRILKDEDEARSVMQETFLQAFQRLHSFRRESKLTTWLYAIGINLARASLRKTRRYDMLEEADIERLQPSFAKGMYAQKYEAWNPQRHAERSERQRLVRSEFEVTIAFNEHGLRGPQRAYAKPPGVSRVLILGDSYAFGQGVEESERFSDVLEQLEPGWRVDNLGMTGWGPDLMLLGLEALVEPIAVCSLLEAQVPGSRHRAQEVHEQLGVGLENSLDQSTARWSKHHGGAALSVYVESDISVHGAPPCWGSMFGNARLPAG